MDLMKTKVFGKERKTPFPNFKSVNNVVNEESQLIDQTETMKNKIHVKRLNFHLKLKPSFSEKMKKMIQQTVKF